MTFRMRKPTRYHARHVMIHPRRMLRVQHHGLAPTLPGASVTDDANVQLPPVYFCSFLFLSRFIFLVGFYQRRVNQKTFVRRFPGLSRAIITDNMSGSAPQFISNTVLLFISWQSLKMGYSQNRRERMRAAPRSI